MSCKSLILLSILVSISGAAYANEIARWTDADGKVHFGNPQFAPAGESESVSVNSANRMDVPKRTQSSSKSRGASVAYIKKAPKKNKRGWRGYHESDRGRSKGAGRRR